MQQQLSNCTYLYLGIAIYVARIARHVMLGDATAEEVYHVLRLPRKSDSPMPGMQSIHRPNAQFHYAPKLIHIFIYSIGAGMLLLQWFGEQELLRHCQRTEDGVQGRRGVLQQDRPQWR